MHNNHYFLRQLSKNLASTLTGAVVSACFSQSKDELIIRFETHGDPFFIKADLLASFSCLSFPENFQRARKNSIDLFEPLIGGRLVSVRQYENERSFSLQFENEIELLFKMHGNRSNIILFSKDEAIHLFKNNIEADATLRLADLDRKIDWSREHFENNLSSIRQTYFTFGKVIWRYLEEINFEAKTTDEKWQIIQDLRAKLEQPHFYIAEISGTPALTLLPFGKVIKEHRDPIRASTDFYYTFSQVYALTKERSSALTVLKNSLVNYQHYFEKTFNKLTEVESDNNYKIWADVLMANLHSIPPRSEKIILPNFYKDDQPVEIKLKKDFSPQKNAEIFYRKSKNQQIEIDRLQKAIAGKESEIESTKNKIEALESSADLKTVRSLISSFGLNDIKDKQPELLPYHAFEFNGFKIWVGRNAQSNDKLTTKFAFKEDLWLHAKDVAGSHVLIKYQSGKKFPKDVIERAAQLAAYNSKRKHESLCPVVVTPKKFVRKRKGDPAGTVVVEREEVIMVEPKSLIVNR
jgi:predicted ribosome quality control (RQC) complex YloA/Tae2 family protein